MLGKRLTLIFSTLIVSAVIALFGGLNVSEVWSGQYIEGFISFAGPYLLLFCFGGLFGKILEDSGASWRLANTIGKKVGDKWVLPVYVAIASLLIYGGVSIFVVVFILLPIAKDIFKRQSIPWSIFPGVTLIAAVAAVAAPGSLQLLNIIPTKFLGTTLTAGLGIGVIGIAVYFLINFVYYKWVLRKREELFDANEFNFSNTKEVDEDEMDKKAPNVFVSMIPIVLALVLINIFKVDIIYGFLISCVVGFIIFRKSLGKIVLRTLNDGLNNGIAPLINVAVVVGIAKTVASVPFFEILKSALVNLPFSGMTKAVVLTNVIALFTGSASGSMTMILDLFGQDFIAWGSNPDALHRILAMAAQGLDSMPWCSVVVMFLSLSGVSYSRGYKHIFVTTVVAPILSTVAMLMVAPLF